MATSANVIEYRIEKNGERVGYFHKHMLCKLPLYSDLLKYQPLNEYIITPYGYDEEEDYWEGKPINLEKFLRKQIPYEKDIKEYFSQL